MTAFTPEELAAIGAAHISDLANFTPNLEFVVAGSTSPTFFIRGIGLNDFNANAAGAVAVYQDDVPLNSPALQLGSLFDVENAAVLRGPQGTGPFRNASAPSSASSTLAIVLPRAVFTLGIFVRPFSVAVRPYSRGSSGPDRETLWPRAR